MNNIFEKLFSLGKNIRMTESEKNKIRHNLVVHMNHRPVQTPSIYFFRTAIIGAFAMLLFISSGTTMVASAQKSLPGEFLYPLKRASESVKKITLSSAIEKADYEIELIEKRFAEANTLLQEKKLDPKIETMISNSIKDHSKNLEKETIKLTSINPAEAFALNTRLQGLLETQTNELLAVATLTNNSSDIMTLSDPVKPTLLALATYEESQKVIEKQKKIEEVILVDATSSTQSLAEEKYTAILARVDQYPDLFTISNTFKSKMIDTSSTVSLFSTDPVILSKEIHTSVPSINTLSSDISREVTVTLPDLLEQIKQAYTEKQYGKIIILANDIEKQISETVKKIPSVVEPISVITPETPLLP